MNHPMNQKHDVFHDLVGVSPQMTEIVGLIRKVSQSKVNVMITGPSGTGKELVARAIHCESSRSRRPFVPINCAAIPEALLESELFGHAKGSFTGAVQSQKGLFVEADGGIIFLDEIGDMSLCLQSKLLRVLQDQKIRSVGDSVEKQINVQVIAATHRNLKAAVKAGQFREDLYYRLQVVEIQMPPLQERICDIPLLVENFIQKHSQAHQLRPKRISTAAIDYLCGQKWPGNIRQLENAVERAITLAESDELEICDFGLQEEARDAVPNVLKDFINSTEAVQVFSESNFPSLDEMNMLYISFILGKTEGKKEKAAKILKIDRTTLHRKLTEFGGHPKEIQNVFNLERSQIN